MSTATNAWARRLSRKERRALDYIVDKLLEARLGVPGDNSREQREHTETWAKVFLEALRTDRAAASAVVAVLKEGLTVKHPPVPDEKTALIHDIRSRLPMVAIGYPELAVEIGRAMDLIEDRE